MNIVDLLDRPIAFQRCFVTITGSINAALLLSQAIYWSKRTKNDDGWFWKTQEEWLDETGMTRYEQERARDKLRCTSFWKEEKRGIPAKLFFRIDDVELMSALQGAKRQVTIDDVLNHSKSNLTGLSKVSLMRANKAGVKSEYVDYSIVLKEHGMHCHICNNLITSTIGQTQESLCFDHVIPITLGGSHTYDNIKPAHAKCNGSKGGVLIDSSIDSKDAYSKHAGNNKDAYSKQTGLLSVDEQAILHETSSSVYSKHANTENTTENTTEITTEIKDIVGKPKKQKNDSTKGSRLNRDWQPSEDMVNYCLTKRPDLDVEETVEDFVGYWVSKAGKDACKVDWDLTWQSWVRKAFTKPIRTNNGSTKNSFIYGNKPSLADQAKASEERVIERMRRETERPIN